MTEPASSESRLQYRTRWRGPQVGGPQQSAEKTAAYETDGWDPRPAGLPLYPRGVGLYKPPGAPIQRVRTLIEIDQIAQGGEN